MALFILATASCFMDYFASFLIKFVLQWCFSQSNEDQSIRKQLLAIKKEMDSISMVDEFAKYAKLQRKYNKLADSVKENIADRSTSRIKWNLILTWGVRIINGIFTSILLFLYRQQPVLTYPEGLFWPIEPILSWPTGVDNCISLPMWIMLLRFSNYTLPPFVMKRFNAMTEEKKTA